MKLPRWVHRLWAFFFGYFWLPCPLCGEKFGGYEWRVDEPSSSIMLSWSEGHGVCPNCHAAAKEYNDKWIKENLPPSARILSSDFALTQDTKQVKVKVYRDGERHFAVIHNGWWMAYGRTARQAFLNVKKRFLRELDYHDRRETTHARSHA